MKKKVLLIVLIIVMMFDITGCGNSKEGSGTGKNSENIVKINDGEIDLSNERDFKEMYYKESYSDLQSSTMNNYRFLQYAKDGKVLLDIRMTYIENKSLEESKKELTFETTPGKNKKGTEYIYGTWVFTDAQTGENYDAHQYFFEHNKTTYTILLLSKENIKEFEKAFIDNVYFK